MDMYTGCPIWSFKGWVGNFYPKGTPASEYLREYAKRLTAVEGNTTFYAVPADKTIEGWVSETPETFKFCAKVPKAISHAGELVPGIERAHEFIRIMSQLGPRMGPMFLQLPPRYSPRYMQDLEAFLEAWPSAVRLAVEVRHLAWFESPDMGALNKLLTKHNMARVIIDTRPIRSLDGDPLLRGSVYQALLEARDRKPDLPIFLDRTADFLFIRYIGHPDLERNIALRAEWSQYIASEMKEGADAYVFCHSPVNLAAPYISRELHWLVREKTGIPPLPWEALQPDEPQQGRLL